MKNQLHFQHFGFQFYTRSACSIKKYSVSMDRTSEKTVRNRVKVLFFWNLTYTSTYIEFQYFAAGLSTQKGLVNMSCCLQINQSNEQVFHLLSIFLEVMRDTPTPCITRDRTPGRGGWTSRKIEKKSPLL